MHSLGNTVKTYSNIDMHARDVLQTVYIIIILNYKLSRGYEYTAKILSNIEMHATPFFEPV